MSVPLMKTCFSSIIFMLFIFLVSHSVSAQREWRVHRVEKGETVYRIARKYQVNPTAILKMNPDAGDELAIGQQLRIPVSNDIITKVEVRSDQDSNRYTVKKGDTKYSLAKKFGLSVSELEATNPQIVPTLMAGSTINVLSETEPKPDGYRSEDVIAESVKPKQVSRPKVRRYNVQSGDTKFSLSRRFEVDIAQLEEVNPQIKNGLRAGEIIKVPVAGDDAEQKTPGSSNRVTGYELGIKPGTLDSLYILVSFSEQEFMEYQSRTGSSTRSSSLSKELDLYNGAIAALDSLSSDELQSVTIFNASKSPSEIQNRKSAIYYVPDNQILQQVPLGDMPVIIVTNSLVGPSLRTDKRYYFQNLENDFKDEVFVLSSALRPSTNVVMISGGDGEGFHAFAKANYPTATYLNVSASERLNPIQLESALDKSTANVVIFNTGDTGILINATNTLLGLSADYKISTVLLKNEFLPESDEISDKRFRILEMTYPKTSISKPNFAIEEGEYNLGYYTMRDLITKLTVFKTEANDNILEIMSSNQSGEIHYKRVGDLIFQVSEIELVKY